MATLKDIAEMVGISISAVSLAIRDHSSISKETKEKVRAAQKQLGYQPNPNRRSKYKDREGAQSQISDIAFVLIDRDFTDKHYALKFEAVTQFSRSKRFRPFYISLEKRDIEHEKLPYILENSNARGIIVTGDYTLAAHDLLSRLKIPILVSGNYYLGETQVSSCEVDLEQGMQLIGDRLYAEGHRKIALIQRPAKLHYRHELASAFHYLLERTGMEGEILNEVPERFERDLTALITRKDAPTALILSTDFLASSITQIMAQCGKRIPEDLSIASFEGQGQVPGVQLATVHADYEMLGRVTLRKLLESISTPNTPPTRERVRMCFEPGESIAPPRGAR